MDKERTIFTAEDNDHRKSKLEPTGADFFVVFVLLRVPWKATLEAVLPELGEPGVSVIGVQTQLQVVVVERFDHFRLELHGDPPLRLLLVPLHHLVTIGPPVAAGTGQTTAEELRTRPDLQPLNSNKGIGNAKVNKNNDKVQETQPGILADRQGLQHKVMHQVPPSFFFFVLIQE